MENHLKSEIDHIVIIVSDLDQSVNWYTTSFGCEILLKEKRLVVLGFRNIKLVLSLPSEQRPHIGIIKSDAADFGEIIEQSDSCHSTFISDPSGNQVELVQYPLSV
ncbi:MAG TPA: VOC family protein [Oligoflexia bacterium]|nr:VOC family protein [Oligoflexia bacterium]HMP48634.1 VOC family protein [Oligoflexia bacterium]